MFINNAAIYVPTKVSSEHKSFS